MSPLREKTPKFLSSPGGQLRSRLRLHFSSTAPSAQSHFPHLSQVLFLDILPGKLLIHVFQKLLAELVLGIAR